MFCGRCCHPCCGFGGFGMNFAIVLVLFILLVIILGTGLVI